MVYTVSSYLLDNGYDTIIPVLIKRRGYNIDAECYPGLEKFCSDYIAKYGTESVKAENLGKLTNDINEYLKKSGYMPDDINDGGIFYVYECSPETILGELTGEILPVTISGGEYDESGLDMPVNCSSGPDDDYNYLACGTVIDGKVVSVCAENSHVLEEDETEIGVETIDEYRNKGYGRNNIIALCKELIASGKKKIIYETDINNTASLRCAASSGLDLVGENCYIIARKL